MSEKRQLLISVVTTLYNSSSYIDEYYLRISKELKKITGDYEILFVDDGSPDDSLEKVLSLRKSDKHVKVIELSRNFGHHKAILTGLKNSIGEFAFVIDCDLEEEPELLFLFWKEMSEKNNDILIGVQRERQGGFIRKYISSYFYIVFNFFSEKSIIKNQVITRLMNRDYLEAIIQFEEADIVLAGISTLAGFKQGTILVDKKFKGSSEYSFSRQIKQLIDSVTSFSSKPLIYIFYLGLNTTFFSLGFIFFFIIDKIFYGISIEGWTSIILSIWLMGGMILFSIGVLGIYLDRIYRQVKNRPFTIIKRKYL